MRHPAHRFAAAVLLVAAAGCGGGSQALPARTAAGGASAQSVTFRLAIPNAAGAAATSRRPAFVSPSTLSGTIRVNAGAVQELDLSLASPNCVAVTGGRTCTIPVSAPIGADLFSLVLYDGAFSGGTHQGVALSKASNFSATVTEGTSNVTIPLVLGGIPETVDVQVAGTLTARTPATVPLLVTAYDHDGNVIVGSAGFTDVNGNAGLTVATAISTTQLTLHDGAQAATSITVAAPTDAVTLQLSGSADILGVPFSVTNGSGTRLAARTSQVVALSGTLTQTFLAAAAFNDFPDYLYLSAMDSTQATGDPNGFVVSTGTQSSGENLGWFDSGTETFKLCTFGVGFNIAPTAVDGGVAVAFNGAYNVDTGPFGVAYYTKATILAGGACGTGARLTNADAHATALGYDQTTTTLLEGTVDNALRTDLFSGGVFSTHATQATYSAAPSSLYAFGTLRSYVVPGTANVYQQASPSAPQSFAAAVTSFTSLVLGPDKRAYALDPSAKRVWVEPGLALPLLYTAGTFSGSVSSQTANLAIGPDGVAYTSDGASLIESLTPSGAASSVTLPSISGNVGFVRGVFDGKNGYVYAYYDDGFHNGTQNVYRISY